MLIKRQFCKNISPKQNLAQNKTNKVLYTVITGDYNKLIRPLYFEDDWKYICFTNNEKLLEKKDTFWEVLPIQTELELDDKKNPDCPKFWHTNFSNNTNTAFI